MSIKINWEEVPEEYEWFAIDKNKRGNVYSEAPQIYGAEDNWTFKGSTGYFQCCDYKGSVDNWKETLQQRPKKTIGISTTQEEKSFEMSLQRIGCIVDLQITGKLSKEQIIKIMEVVYE